MSLDDYSVYDGLDLAGLVASKSVQTIELVDAAIARIERHNPKLNAVIWTMFDRARAMAKAPLPPGRFAGVGRVRQRGVISGVAPGRHRQAALGVSCSVGTSSMWGVASAVMPSSCM